MQPVAMTRIRLGLAMLGRKPGGSDVLACLLEQEQLPGSGWTVLDQRTWRTGVGASAAWQHRAKAIGSITSWRSFEQVGTSRWLWVQVVPLATESDAIEAVASAPTRMLRNLSARVRVVEEHQVVLPAPFAAPAGWAVEQRTEGKIGQGSSFMVVVASGRYSLVLAASSLGEPWTWDDLCGLARQQVSRLPT